MRVIGSEWGVGWENFEKNIKNTEEFDYTIPVSINGKSGSDNIQRVAGCTCNGSWYGPGHEASQRSFRDTLAGGYTAVSATTATAIFIIIIANTTATIILTIRRRNIMFIVVTQVVSTYLIGREVNCRVGESMENRGHVALPKGSKPLFFNNPFRWLQ
jgi:hypothetical protein